MWLPWTLSCKGKGHQFNSISGHMLGLWARFPVSLTRQCFPLSLLPFSSLKLNKNLFFFFKDLSPQFFFFLSLHSGNVVISLPTFDYQFKLFLENQDGSVGRHTAPPHTTRTDRKSNGKEVQHQVDKKETHPDQ